MRNIEIINTTRPLSNPLHATYCGSFWSRFKGLMFRKHLGDCESILLDESSESRINTAIHMLFMNFDISAVWINQQNTIVDVKLARKWRLYYAPAAPARYILEAHPGRLADFQPGDSISFVDVA